MRGIFLTIGASIFVGSCGIGPQAVSNLSVDANVHEGQQQVLSHQMADDQWLLENP